MPEEEQPPLPESSRTPEAIAAYREARARTIDAWLERNHQRISRIPGFRAMCFPDADTGLRIRVENDDAMSRVMDVLVEAQREGYDVDWENFHIGFDTSELPVPPHVIQ